MELKGIGDAKSVLGVDGEVLCVVVGVEESDGWDGLGGRRSGVECAESSEYEPREL